MESFRPFPGVIHRHGHGKCGGQIFLTDDLTYMEDPQRCNVLAEILANFARTRIPLTADEAVNTVRDMYNFMSWH